MPPVVERDVEGEAAGAGQADAVAAAERRAARPLQLGGGLARERGGVATEDDGDERRALRRRRLSRGDELRRCLRLHEAALAGDAQARYEHALPLDVGAAPARISLTFRSIVPGFEE